MTIEELLKMQDDFDSSHNSNFIWNKKIDKDTMNVLEFIVLGLAGEVGELANLTKKIVRGDYNYDDKLPEIKEEAVDIFIYLLKLINQMDIDIEKEYMKKIQKNKERFKDYEKQ